MEREQHERAEQERKEKERAEREQQVRAERERIIRESAAAAADAAVNQHFQESLRRASQKVGTWLQPAISSLMSLTQVTCAAC